MIKKFRKLFVFLCLPFLLASCANNEYEINKEATLTGVISTEELTSEDGKITINILTLTKPIVINGTKINKIEINSDKQLKDNETITITGVIEPNKDNDNQLGYTFDVLSVDDILSYVSTFSNDEFSMTIPTELMQVVQVKEIENGFSVNVNANGKVTEVFKAIIVPNEQVEHLENYDYVYYEKAESNREKTVLFIYPKDDSSSTEEFESYEDIFKNIDNIKETVIIK